MRTIFNADHRFHQSPGELLNGAYVPAFEKPERADLIRAEIERARLGEISAPQPYPLSKLTAIHDAGMIDLFQHAYAEWQEAGRSGGAIPFTFGTRGVREDRVPRCLDGKLAYYSFDAGTPITPTSWRAIKSSADTALTASSLITQGERSAFALCRPPGHHAGTDHYGGYCFLNNAAIAAQAMLGDGAARIAILDIDYHHGNGTQQIFYRRNDVLFVSIHGDPDAEFPYRLGFADETGAADGEGMNANYPLPLGTEWPAWSAALDHGLTRIQTYRPDIVIVSLGVDTYKHDPISQFRLEREHFTRIGERIASLARPTMFVMEGGYAVEDIGINVVNVLSGFETA
ncbi:histone deacetylase family protein [Acidiphilium sp. AL]|uniref:histone deacetylase family protein n=1 Tax=Acidiphilium sp. AL TaxID=2871704 RepID=UPI0021CB3EC9|nr:histone deacetylase family protein [Acidiphilium sp. AL]MCU4160371.1 histone deacetylase family protein [Acidiphilium sp. AL]